MYFSKVLYTFHWTWVILTFKTDLAHGNFTTKIFWKCPINSQPWTLFQAIFTNKVRTHLSLWVLPWVWSRYPKNTNKLCKRTKEDNTYKTSMNTRLEHEIRNLNTPPMNKKICRYYSNATTWDNHCGQQIKAASHFILLALLKINGFCVNSVHTIWSLSFLENYYVQPFSCCRPWNICFLGSKWNN